MMSQADFRFFNIKHSMTPPHPPLTPGNFTNNKFEVVLPLLQVAHPATESTPNHPQFKRAKNCCGHSIPSQGTSSDCAPGSWLCPPAPWGSRDFKSWKQTSTNPLYPGHWQLWDQHQQWMWIDSHIACISLASTAFVHLHLFENCYSFCLLSSYRQWLV